METSGTTGEETTSYWFDLPIDVAEFEEKLGVGAESGDYRIIEKVLPFADEVHEHTSVYQLNELDFMYRQSKESMYKLSYVIRVSAPDLDELKRRCDEVKDFYDDLNVKLVRPAGDMLGLHSEFLPASKRYINDYVQYVKSDFLAGLGFGATQQLGETTGIYMGYSVDTGRNVYLQPSLASQGYLIP